MAFIGEYHHNIDSKGRMALPVKFRSKLVAGGMITRGLDQCLFVYAAKDWEELLEKITCLPLTQANARAFSRLMLGGAIDFDLDNQGRVLIPEHLRKYAGLGKKIAVVGLWSRAEIWDEAKWEAYREKAEKESGEIAEKLEGLGI